MVWYRRLSDRRGRLRFELVGQLWGTLGITEPLVLCDVCRGGALVKSRVPLPAGSVHRMRFVTERDHTEEIQVRVCHVTATTGGVAGERFLIGLEFVGLESAALEQIGQLLAAGDVRS